MVKTWGEVGYINFGFIIIREMEVIHRYVEGYPFGLEKEN
jgi:hypothetical protein